VHCAIIKIFKEPIGIDKSDIDLLVGDNLFDRAQNFFLFHRTLQTILESEIKDNFLDYAENKAPDLYIEFTEKYVESLIRELNISTFNVRNQRKQSKENNGPHSSGDESNQHTDYFTVQITTSDKLIGFLCGSCFSVELEYTEGKMEIKKYAQIVS
jgi:hypothetical protein